MPEQNMPHQQPSEEDDVYEANSLSDYIARHLQNNELSPYDKTSTSSKNIFNFQGEAYNKLHAPDRGNKGMILHHYDTQLANGHLERYLPTPSTRFQLSRERLGKELALIYKELKQYRQLKGTEHKARIEALEKRANLIQRKIFDLDLKLAKSNPFQSMYKSLQKLADKPKNEHKSGRSAWTFIPNFRHLQNEASTVNQELQSIQQFLDNHLHDPTFTAEQLSQLVNQYDACLQKAEKLMEEMRNKKSIGERLKKFF